MGEMLADEGLHLTRGGRQNHGANGLPGFAILPELWQTMINNPELTRSERIPTEKIRHPGLLCTTTYSSAKICSGGESKGVRDSPEKKALHRRGLYIFTHALDPQAPSGTHP